MTLYTKSAIIQSKYKNGKDEAKMKKAERFLAVILIIGCLSRTHYVVKAQNIKVISGEGENKILVIYSAWFELSKFQ